MFQSARCFKVRVSYKFGSLGPLSITYQNKMLPDTIDFLKAFEEIMERLDSIERQMNALIRKRSRSPKVERRRRDLSQPPAVRRRMQSPFARSSVSSVAQSHFEEEDVWEEYTPTVFDAPSRKECSICCETKEAREFDFCGACTNTFCRVCLMKCVRCPICRVFV